MALAATLRLPATRAGPAGVGEDERAFAGAPPRVRHRVGSRPRWSNPRPLATRRDPLGCRPGRTREDPATRGAGGRGEDPPWPWASRGACMGGGGLGGRTGAPGGSTAGACKRGLGRQVRGSRRRCGPENRAVPPAPDARLLAHVGPRGGADRACAACPLSPRGCVPWDHSSPTTARPDWTRRRPRPLRCPRPPLLRPQLPPSGNAFPAPSRGIWPGSLVVGLER